MSKILPLISNHTIAPTPPDQPKVNGPQNEQDQRIQDGAQKILKNPSCPDLCKWIAKVVKLIKEIPSHIADAIIKCFSLEDDDEIDFDEEDEDLPTHLLEGNNEMPEPLLAFQWFEELKTPENAIDSFTLRHKLYKLEMEASKIQVSVSTLKLKTINDLKTLKEYGAEINEYLSNINGLKILLTAPEIDQNVRNYSEARCNYILGKFWGAKKRLEEKCEDNSEKIKKIADNARVIEEGEQPLKKPPIIKAFLEASREKEVADVSKIPPQLYNDGRNNCWLHASLEVLWAMGDDFHQMVREKAKDLASMSEEFEKEMKIFERLEKEYRAQKKVYKDEQKKELEHKKVVDHYREKIYPAYEKEDKALLDEFKQQMAEYQKKLQEHAEWEATDRTAVEPIVPPKPERKQLKRPEPPPDFDSPKKPFKPFKPGDPILLYNELKHFSEALQFGKRDDVQDAVKRLQKVVPLYFHEYRDVGVQHDAHTFFEEIFQFLSTKSYGPENKPGLFPLEVDRKALPNSKYAGFKFNRIESIVNLQLNFVPKKEQFQDLFDDYFEEKIVNNPDEPMPLYNPEIQEEAVQSSEYVEKVQIANALNPPEFFIVAMKRYYYPTKDQINEERKAFEGWRRKKITAKAIELKETEEFKDKEPLEILKIAEDQLIQKREIWEFNPNEFRARKINAPIKFPPTHRVNFAKAFGKNSNDPNYTYELAGTVIQNGVTQGGHYIANVLSKNGTWYLTDNMGGKVIPQTAEEALKLNEDGYIYYFKKVKIAQQ